MNKSKVLWYLQLSRIFSIIHNLKRNVAEKLLTSGRNPVEHNFDSTHNDDIVAEEIDQMDESAVSSM